MKLKDQVALVTGGGTGIGRAVVEMLVREGAKVAINGVDIVKSSANQYGTKNIGGFAAAQKVAEEMTNLGFKAFAVEADVTDAEQVEKMVQQTIDYYGKLDILVHAAGILFPKYIMETTEEEWDYVINTNLKSTFLTNKAVLAHMQENGYGRIVNFSSLAGKQTNVGLGAYSVSKFGVTGFTSCLAKEVAHDGITVNAVCPGIVATKMWEELSGALSLMGMAETPDDAFREYCALNIPQGEPQTVEDMADAVLFLLTAKHITGLSLSVDGGVTY